MKKHARNMVQLLLLSGLIDAVSACTSSRGDRDHADAGAEPPAPIVTDKRTDLLFSWNADGGPMTANTVDRVPDSAKKNVRVQDPSVPPEKRDPRWLFFADLTAPQANGHYPVRALTRAAYEAKRKKIEEKPTPATAASPGVAHGTESVVMYATKHCPVCMKARRWLL